ncbi:MAG: EAL domain-containing protein [Gammaproteobacteria bacterium]|nr:EAL domain-containing protein [Gammaproteobacteria bacterium]
MIKSLSPEIASIVLSNIKDGIMVTDPNNEIVFVNKAFSKVTGYSEQEVVGCNPNLLNSGRHDEQFFTEMWNTLDKTGHWKGEIWDKRKNGDVYLEFLSISAIKNSEGKIEHFVAVFTDINEKRKAEQQLDRAALYDVLTDLPNRVQTIHYLQNKLIISRREHKLLAVIMLDLDDFKSTNDKFGHDLGDRLLIVIAQRLQRLIRSTDMVGRLGGDEFAIILSDLNNFDEVEQMTSRINSLVASSIMVDGKKYKLTTSLGITLFPFDDSDAEMLLRHADQAMYKAKDNGKNQCHLFDVEKDQQAQTRRELLQELSSALKNDELVLFYQPKVNMRTGSFIGVEALIRWQHPEKGLIGPGHFLPHVEYHDLIIEIGEWVIRKALTQLAFWLANGLRITVSVNISARQILQHDFVSLLKEILSEFPEIPLELLELEILESAALENTDHVARVIEQCRKIGIHFALDDFGTGYASLSYLRDIPADVLKIDQSFVFNLLEKRKDLALVEGIIGLATAFQRTVIAEGIEKTEQGVLLMRLGCDLGQGFGIAKPMPADNILVWAGNYQPDQEWSIWADTSWEISDFPLLVAQHDHINWVRNVLLYIEGKTNSVNQKILVNHHECRFGHWYYDYGMQRYKHIETFLEIEPIHISIHHLGYQIVKLCDGGNERQAKEKASILLQLKDQILEKLAALQKKVVSSQ